jgi:hypothetical protein
LYHLPSISGLAEIADIPTEQLRPGVSSDRCRAPRSINVKEIRDKALALEVYSRQAQNVEAERRCC